MGNDTDRLQQMEDNWNNRDSVYNKLGEIQTKTRKALKEEPLSKAICNGHLVMASAGKISDKIVVRSFIDRAEVRRKEGRYHDWFFRDNQFNETLIRLEAKEGK